jgi:large repetitive protein
MACALALTAALGCTPRPALQFSPVTLADAQVGSSYAATITVSQAVTPVGGASIQDGALPAGLDLVLAKDPANTIQISGTPTVAGTFSFTIYVWCYGTNVNGQTATQGYTLLVK